MYIQPGAIQKEGMCYSVGGETIEQSLYIYTHTQWKYCAFTIMPLGSYKGPAVRAHAWSSRLYLSTGIIIIIHHSAMISTIEYLYSSIKAACTV
jgi:hypothetical protein